MSVTIGGIVCEERKGSKSGVLSRDESRNIRLFSCPWADRGAVMAALLGYTAAVGEVSTWQRPMRYSAGSYLFVQNIAHKGWKPLGMESDGSMKYERCYLDVSYGPLEHDPDDEDENRWAEVRSKTSLTFLQIPAWGLRWESDEAPFDEDAPAAIPIAVREIIIVRYNLKSLPMTAFDAAVGKLNSSAFMRKAAKTLVFAGWDYERSIDENGRASLFSATVTLQWRKAPWDQAFRPGLGWRQFETTGGTAPFDTTDFNSI